VKRGEIWWASLREPAGSEPGYTRPVLIVSANSFNESRNNTVLAAVVTTNIKLGNAPGNVRLASKAGGLPKPSVVNVSQIITVDKMFLTERIGRLSPQLIAQVEEGLRIVLALGPRA
jgi:mRNA interferase MazF